MVLRIMERIGLNRAISLPVELRFTGAGM
jgi:hypothetical protein